MRTLLICGVACAFAGSIAATSQASADILHVTTGQGAREAIVLPAQRPAAPTVIVLHGATITAERTAQGSGFAEAAAAHGFAAVFPQGIDRQWNDGREGRTSSVDDVGFLRLLVQQLVDRHVADPAHIFIAGISNGGMMTFRMLCEAPELFAGAATVIANMPAGIGEHCTLRKPMPIVMFNGTADPLVPYEGGGVGFFGKRGLVWGAERTAEFMAHANACEAARVTPLPVESAAEAVHVSQLEWAPCRTGAGVTLYRFEGGGHQMPGRTVLPGLLGPGYAEMKAADKAFALFAP
jgi:polyhydroxybutyrate depolymerase